MEHAYNTEDASNLINNEKIKDSEKDADIFNDLFLSIAENLKLY
jgi:hypothetical protein